MEKVLESVKGQVSGLVKAAEKRENLPYTIAAGVVLAVGGGLVLRRWATAPREGSESEWQKSLGAAAKAGDKYELRRLKPSDDGPALEKLLGEAMASEPVVRACAAKGMSDDALRSAAAWLYGTAVRACLPSSTGAVVLGALAGDKVEGLAVVFPPKTEFDESEFVMQGGWKYPAVYSGLERAVRWPAVAEQTTARRRRLTRRFGSDFVYVMATTWLERSRAATGAILDRVLAECDARNLPAYAEVSDPAYTAEWLSRGFVVVETLPLFGTSVSMLVRAPRKPDGTPAFPVTDKWLAGIPETEAGAAAGGGSA